MSKDKSRILLVTLVGRNFNDNYGAVLQAYATQSFLNYFGYEVEILDYEHLEIMGYIERFKKYLHKYGIIRTIKKSMMFTVHKIIKLPRDIIQRVQQHLRKQNFNNFKTQHLLFTKDSYLNHDSIVHHSSFLKEAFDIFLVGSDQVWNPKLNEESLKVHLLGFVQGVKKISYASSVCSDIPGNLIDLYKRFLSEFDCISVREEGSAIELEKILGYRPFINVDPTFLLDAQQWSEIAKKPNVDIQKPYIFVYDLYRSESILPVVEKVSKWWKFKYVNYTPILFLRKIRFPNLQYTYYTDGPSVFLWLLKESDFVITSSFHGVAFSLIFAKPFYAILWDRKEKLRQNDRIISLLKKVGLEERCFADPKEILKRGLDKNIDWKKVHEDLRKLREESANWLLKALKGENQECNRLRTK
jgi:hypothetical protein